MIELCIEYGYYYDDNNEIVEIEVLTDEGTDEYEFKNIDNQRIKLDSSYIESVFKNSNTQKSFLNFLVDYLKANWFDMSYEKLDRKFFKEYFENENAFISCVLIEATGVGKRMLGIGKPILLNKGEQ